MILQDVAMLCISNNRTQFYLNALVKDGFYPAFLIILENQSKEVLPGQRTSDLEVTFIQNVRKLKIPYRVVPTSDVNSTIVVDAVQTRPESYFIYSGPGGVILRKNLLDTGKQFLHVHPGRLPMFRGSTTLYYHILTEGRCAASALFLKEKIDTGPVLAVKEYPLPTRGTDLDYVYDPQIRAELLSETINNYLKDGHFTMLSQDIEKGETYFIIHPVLRHIAQLYCDQR